MCIMIIFGVDVSSDLQTWNHVLADADNQTDCTLWLYSNSADGVCADQWPEPTVTPNYSEELEHEGHMR